MSVSVPIPITTKELAKWRAQIEQALVHFDLIPGMQAICKRRFKRLADYQVAIIRECFKRDPNPSVIIGGREIAKTMSIALGYFLRCITEPNFEVFLVPGQKIDQSKVPLRYVNILAKHSSVVKQMSGLDRHNSVEWSTMTKQFTNGALMHALAPNEGVVSEHGCVWCDEYQYLSEDVDNALQGFTGRPGDRMLYSGTANVRGSPLHRVWNVAKRRYPQNVIEVPVELAFKAEILDRASIEAKKMENGGKLSPTEFDAWFNCKFPDLGTLAWHPIESSVTRADMLVDPARFVATGTGEDPGLPVNRFVIVSRLSNDEVHCIEEFELGDMDTGLIPTRSLGQIAVEYGKVFGGGYNAPYHSLLEMNGIKHLDSNVDGEARNDLFAGGFRLQSIGRLFVNPNRCPNLWRACEEQTFDESGEMDRLPLTHWIYAMLHAIRAATTRPLSWETISTRAKW
jgi:hypothetical protein